MIFNVAQLLKAPVGSIQSVELDDSDPLDLAADDVSLAGPITGTVRLHRTNQGIYARGGVTAAVRIECSRCLKELTTTLRFPLEEEYYPTIDVNTGLPVPPPSNNDLAFPISRHHEVDMREAIRQNLLLALPARALCREECAGLCPHCGKDLNEGPCDCQPDVEDARLSPLRELLDGHEPAQTS